jgi:cell division protein ZapA
MSKVSVKIRGCVYDVEAAPGDELLIHSLAEYLEQKIAEVERDTGFVDTQKCAVMAAMNIADELFRLRNSKENISGFLDKKADELIHILDKALTA